MNKLQNSFLAILVSVCFLACGSPSSTGGGGGENPPPEEPNEDTTPPSAPAGIDGTSGDEVVNLAWDDNGEDDLDGYNLYRSESSFSDISAMDPINGNFLTEIEFSDDDVDNGTTYYYRLTAVDENENESSTSSEIEVTPFSNPPDRPKK